MKKFDFKSNFDNDNYGPGLRVVITLFLAVLLTVGVIMFSETLPTGIGSLDISTNNIHSISAETKDMLSDLDEKVDMYYVCQKGQENLNTQYMLNLYADSSKNITITTLDPAFDILAIEEFTGDTKIDDNSIILAGKERSQLLKFSDFFSNGVFALEDYLNSGINFVTGKTSKMAYYITGHDEVTLDPDTISYMGLDGFLVEDINLQEQDIPEDASVLLLNGPRKELSDEETRKIMTYLENGGSIQLNTIYAANDLKSVAKITGFYGLEIGSGLIMEHDENRVLENNPINIMPSIYSSGDDALTSGVEQIVMPGSKPIVIPDDIPEDVEITKILETTENSYAVSKNIFTNQNDSVDGPFVIGVAATKKLGTDSKSQMVWYSTEYITNMELSEYVNGGNTVLFLNSVCYLGQDNDVSSIYGKTVSTKYLTINDSKISFWKMLMIFIIPVIVLAVGALVLIRRKRR